VVRVDTHPKKALAFSSDVTPRYVEADPFEGGKQAVAECWRNITATGALPLAATDNLNFGNPEKPEIMGQMVFAIKGIGEACKALDFPIVSGNVSLYQPTSQPSCRPRPRRICPPRRLGQDGLHPPAPRAKPCFSPAHRPVGAAI
jgi:phosphoribosylformylglycinamidine synthase